MKNFQGYVDPGYLQKVAQIVSNYKTDSYRLMEIKHGHSVLDVGCGPGTDAVNLAKLVGSSGKVFGIDSDPEMIALAHTSLLNNEYGERISYKVADAKELPFPENRFDASRCERVFQHLDQPEAALAEMIRVTKSKGKIVVLDTDWSTLSIDTCEKDIENRLNRFRLASFIKNGYSGRELFRFFVSHEMQDVSIRICPVFQTSYAVTRQGALLDKLEQRALELNIISTDELQRWHEDLENKEKRGTFFSCLNQIIVSASKP